MPGLPDGNTASVVETEDDDAAEAPDCGDQADAIEEASEGQGDAAEEAASDEADAFEDACEDAVEAAEAAGDTDPDDDGDPVSADEPGRVSP